MNNKIKEFSNHRGSVSIMFDGLHYHVKWVQYSNKKTGCPQITIEYTETDAVLAAECYTACVNKLKGKPWVEPSRNCGYATGRVKACTASNCPRALGGASYWEIFRSTCAHRQK